MNQIFRKLSRAEKERWEKISLLDTTRFRPYEQLVSPVWIAAVSLHMLKDNVPPGCLLTRQIYRIFGHIPLEEDLLWIGSMRERREQQSRVVFKLDSEVTDKNGQSYFTLQTTLVNNKDNRTLNLPDISETDHTGLEISETWVKEYLELSGDPNPIHRQVSGESRVIVPGLLISLLLTDSYLPHLRTYQLEIRYHRPVYTGDKISLNVVGPGVYAACKGNILCTEMRLKREET